MENGVDAARLQVPSHSGGPLLPPGVGPGRAQFGDVGEVFHGVVEVRDFDDPLGIDAQGFGKGVCTVPYPAGTVGDKDDLLGLGRSAKREFRDEDVEGDRGSLPAPWMRSASATSLSRLARRSLALRPAGLQPI